MKTFEFTVVASDLDHEAEDFEDRFWEAGCDDATVSVMRGRILVDFHRAAECFEMALASAIEDVRAAGATVEHVEPDDLTSLADIAERAALSRAAVSLYAQGRRGKGFPAPVARVTSDSPFWSWTDVAGWLRARGKLDDAAVTMAAAIRRTNRDLRRRRDRDAA